jgi:hypothetical protein
MLFCNVMVFLVTDRTLFVGVSIHCYGVQLPDGYACIPLTGFHSPHANTRRMQMHGLSIPVLFAKSQLMNSAIRRPGGSGKAFANHLDTVRQGSARVEVFQ